jgi:hypothetical protein
MTRVPRVIGQGPDEEYRVGNAADPRRFIFTDGVHLVVDGDRDVDLLHQFARRIGLRPEWFQGDHYDLTTPNAAERAVVSGATLIDKADVARVMRPTGHRRRPGGWAPASLGSGAPAARLARERHGDVLEFIQGPGRRAWLGSNVAANRTHPPGGPRPRVVRVA